MSIPGFTPPGGEWASTVPGWQAPPRDPSLTASHLKVSLDDRVLETGWQETGDYRDLVSLDGWWEGPEIRAESMTRPGQDGEQEGQILLGARPISVQGSIHTQDRATLLREMARYGSVLTGAARYGMLTVVESELGLARQCRVRLAQPTVVVPDGDRFASVAWSLRAADPIRYEAVERSVTVRRGGPNARVENTGNRPVGFLLDLVGPLVDPEFWIDGQMWKLNRTIPAGTTVIAYWGDHEVMSASTSLRFYQQGPWPLLAPGITEVGLAGGGTGTARVRWRSGWL